MCLKQAVESTLWFNMGTMCFSDKPGKTSSWRGPSRSRPCHDETLMSPTITVELGRTGLEMAQVEHWRARCMLKRGRSNGETEQLDADGEDDRGSESGSTSDRSATGDVSGPDGGRTGTERERVCDEGVGRREVERADTRGGSGGAAKKRCGRERCVAVVDGSMRGGIPSGGPGRRGAATGSAGTGGVGRCPDAGIGVDDRFNLWI
jgi:hypothetical protein